MFFGAQRDEYDRHRTGPAGYGASCPSNLNAQRTGGADTLSGFDESADFRNALSFAALQYGGRGGPRCVRGFDKGEKSIIIEYSTAGQAAANYDFQREGTNK